MVEMWLPYMKLYAQVKTCMAAGCYLSWIKTSTLAIKIYITIKNVGWSRDNHTKLTHLDWRLGYYCSINNIYFTLTLFYYRNTKYMKNILDSVWITGVQIFRNTVRQKYSARNKLRGKHQNKTHLDLVLTCYRWITLHDLNKWV